MRGAAMLCGEGDRKPRLTLDEAIVYAQEQPGDLLAVDELLSRLAEIDSRQSRVVELRIFGGSSVEEIATGSGAVTAERWERIKMLFRSALEHAQPKRARFLEEACGAGSELRQEVESLLYAHKSTETISEPQAACAEAGVASRRIGPYTLVREIGRGGMAVVYLAARSDDQFRKLVALKIVNALSSAEIIRRFQNERQTLAGLDHANIVKLLDGGATVKSSVATARQ
jgi:hypothetical protein